MYSTPVHIKIEDDQKVVVYEGFLNQGPKSLHFNHSTISTHLYIWFSAKTDIREIQVFGGRILCLSFKSTFYFTFEVLFSHNKLSEANTCMLKFSLPSCLCSFNNHSFHFWQFHSFSLLAFYIWIIHRKISIWNGIIKKNNIYSPSSNLIKSLCSLSHSYHSTFGGFTKYENFSLWRYIKFNYHLHYKIDIELFFNLEFHLTNSICFVIFGDTSPTKNRNQQTKWTK